MRRLGRDQRGFTLIELVVVLTIIGVLAVLIVPSVAGYADSAKKKSTLADAKNLQTALVLYYSDHGRYPTAGARGEIKDYATLRSTLSDYVKLPASESGANFEYVRYDARGDRPSTFTLVIKARDNNQTQYTITPGDITSP